MISDQGGSNYSVGFAALPRRAMFLERLRTLLGTPQAPGSEARVTRSASLSDCLVSIGWSEPAGRSSMLTARLSTRVRRRFWTAPLSLILLFQLTA